MASSSDELYYMASRQIADVYLLGKKGDLQSTLKSSRTRLQNLFTRAPSCTLAFVIVLEFSIKTLCCQLADSNQSRCWLPLRPSSGVFAEIAGIMKIQHFRLPISGTSPNCRSSGIMLLSLTYNISECSLKLFQTLFIWRRSSPNRYSTRRIHNTIHKMSQQYHHLPLSHGRLLTHYFTGFSHFLLFWSFSSEGSFSSIK